MHCSRECMSVCPGQAISLSLCHACKGASSALEMMLCLVEHMMSRGTWDLSLRCFGGFAEFECKARGAARMAYPSVVAGGTDSCTIHYLRNNKVCCSTLLLLMSLYSFWQRNLRLCSRHMRMTLHSCACGTVQERSC